MAKSKPINVKFAVYIPKLLFCCFLLVLSALTVSNISVYFNSKPKIIYANNDSITHRVGFWKTFLYSHPQYFEGWVELTKLELKIGNIDGAKATFAKALEINPNSEEISSLRGLFNAY
jgi:hypothetical protein